MTSCLVLSMFNVTSTGVRRLSSVYGRQQCQCQCQFHKRHAEVIRLFFVRLVMLIPYPGRSRKSRYRRADLASQCRQGTVNLLLHMLEKFDDEEQLEHRQHHVVVWVVDTVLKGTQPIHRSTLFRGLLLATCSFAV